MKKYLLSLGLLGLLTSVILADPTTGTKSAPKINAIANAAFKTYPAPPGATASVKLPEEIHVEPGRLLKLTAETNDKYVQWILYSQNADLIPFESTKTAIFSSPTQGDYVVVAITANGDIPSQPAVCHVIVGPAVPIPPAPPGPPPAPVDTFQKDLQASYTADTAADKENKKGMLVYLYKNAASSTVSSQKTVGDLINVMHTATQSVLGDSLVGVRKVIEKQLNTKLPIKADQVIDDSNRQQFVDAFNLVADALSKVK